MSRTREASEAQVTALPASRSGEAVDALCDAFHDYPVMRHVLGEAGKEYDRLLHLMISLFVAGRVLRGHPVFVVEEDSKVIAVATVTLPGPMKEMPEFTAQRDALWRELGGGARDRHENLVAIWERMAMAGPQHHLNMLGVRRSHAGKGLGRRLLDAVHELAERHPESAGVSLSTEDPKNVPLYQHCGYEIVSYERVSDDLETWTLFRKNDAPERRES